MDEIIDDSKNERASLQDRYNSLKSGEDILSLSEIKSLVEDLLQISDSPTIENRYWWLSANRYAGFYYMACVLAKEYTLVLDGFTQKEVTTDDFPRRTKMRIYRV